MDLTPGAARLTIAHLSVAPDGLTTTCTVTLQRGDRSYDGTVECATEISAVQHAVAGATAAAVAEALGPRVRLEVETTSVVPVGVAGGRGRAGRVGLGQGVRAAARGGGGAGRRTPGRDPCDPRCREPTSRPRSSTADVRREPAPHPRRPARRPAGPVAARGGRAEQRHASRCDSASARRRHRTSRRCSCTASAATPPTGPTSWRCCATGSTAWPSTCPGFGWSPPPRDGDYTPRRNAESLAELVEKRFDGRPVHLFGNSMGGAIAVQLAARRPDLVRTLTLVSPALPKVGVRRTNVHLPVIAAPGLGHDADEALPRRSTPPRARKATIDVCFADPASVPLPRMEEAVQEVRRRDALPYVADAFVQSLRGLMATYLDRTPERPWKLAERITCPTLLVYGRRDKLVDPIHAHTKAFPDVRVLVLPHAGHVVPDRAAGPRRSSHRRSARRWPAPTPAADLAVSGPSRPARRVGRATGDTWLLSSAMSRAARSGASESAGRPVPWPRDRAGVPRPARPCPRRRHRGRGRRHARWPTTWRWPASATSCSSTATS